MDRRGALVAATGVDQDHPFISYDDSEAGIVAQILRCAVAERADDGVDAVTELFNFESLVGVYDRELCQYQQTGQQPGY